MQLPEYLKYKSLSSVMTISDFRKAEVFNKRQTKRKEMEAKLEQDLPSPVDKKIVSSSSALPSSSASSSSSFASSSSSSSSSSSLSSGDSSTFLSSESSSLSSSTLPGCINVLRKYSTQKILTYEAFTSQRSCGTIHTRSCECCLQYFEYLCNYFEVQTHTAEGKPILPRKLLQYLLDLLGDNNCRKGSVLSIEVFFFVKEQLNNCQKCRFGVMPLDTNNHEYV